MTQETLEEVSEKYANESFVPMRNSDGEILRIPSGQTVPCGFTKHKKVAIKHFTNGYKLALERSYSEKEVILLLQKAITHQDDGETGSLVTAQGKIRTANFYSWFEKFKKK